MRKKALQRIIDAIEARTRATKNFLAGRSNWVSLKSRPTQFESAKNFPAGPRDWWKKKETSEPAPIA